MKKWKITVFLGILALGLCIKEGRTLWPDPVADVGVLRVLLNGVQRFRVETNSSGDLLVNETLNTNGNAFVVRTKGGFAPLQRTTTQIQSLTGGTADDIIYNTSLHTLCRSSGTAAGSWVIIGSTGQPSPPFPTPCGN